MNLKNTNGDIISAVVGWIYFTMWSVSFYPQIYSNWKRKSVVGLSFDFLSFNMIGYLCYSAYTSSFFWSDYIQNQYRDRHDGHSNTVELNDVFFALHAAFFTAITIVQVLTYERGLQRVSKICIIICTILVLFAIASALICVFDVLPWIDFFYFLSYIKLCVTLMKYSPQVYLNFRRKSTEGWSIWQILLDLGGGVLSLTQLIFDSWRSGTWTGITGNPTKFGLAFISIFYDLIFICQHYVIYNKSRMATQYDRLNDAESHLEKPVASVNDVFLAENEWKLYQAK